MMMVMIFKLDRIYQERLQSVIRREDNLNISAKEKETVSTVYDDDDDDGGDGGFGDNDDDDHDFGDGRGFDDDDGFPESREGIVQTEAVFAGRDQQVEGQRGIGEEEGRRDSEVSDDDDMDGGHDYDYGCTEIMTLITRSITKCHNQNSLFYKRCIAFNIDDAKVCGR